MKVAYYYKARGFKVRQEVPIGQGKAGDLVIEKGGHKTAVEIETGNSKAMENIKKCTETGFRQIICVATNPLVEKQIKERLTREQQDRAVKIVGCKGYC